MAAACTCCVYHVRCCSCLFSKEQTWSKSLRNFPKCSPTTWSSWLEQGGKKNAGEKSYKFFREGYVYDVYTCQQGEDFHVKARCYRSLRKSEEPHFLAVIFKDCDGRADVFKAHCSCKGGSGGHCNHVFALLFQLNDYSCLNIKDIPSDATCTSLPQSWHIPRATSICPLPVMGTHYARSETDRNGERSRDPIRCKLYDARGPALRCGLQRQHVIDQVVHLNQKETPPPFSYLLSDQEPGLLINTVFGNLPLGACLAHQLQDYGRPNTTFLTNYLGGTSPRDSPVPRCLEFPDIPQVDVVPFDLNEIQALDQTDSTDFFVHHVLIDLKEAHALERRTVLQGESAEWLDQHKYRLTASNFGKVYFRVQRPSEAMLKNIFEAKDLTNVRAISHGKAKEKLARTIYAKKMQKQVPGFAVFDAGLSVHPSFPYLGASPDGKVFDPSTDSKYGLLEIKCPFSKRGETLDQAAADPKFYLQKVGGKFFLKKEHTCGYYAQVQGQLALTGLKWCDFCIYLSDSNEMCVDRIYFDTYYWTNKLLPKLSQFYLHHALQFLVGRARPVNSCSQSTEDTILVNSIQTV